MSTVRPIKWLLALLVILVGGLIRLPLEHAFSKELKERQLAEERLNLSLRDELGQSFFIAVLGGFRSLVASIIEVKNLDSWQQQNWAKVDASYAICTRLQPREYHYWDFRSWMSAYNAFDYYRFEDQTRPGLQPWIRQNLIDHGIAVLEEGMKHLPDDYRLPRAIATLKADFEKNRDASYAEASAWFYKAWQLRPKHRFLWRNYVYNLARAPGNELEAWPLLLEMFNSGEGTNGDRTPTGNTLLVQLYPKVRTLLPGAALPAEVAAQVPAILASEMARKEREMKRQQKREAEQKAVEEAVLQQKQRQ
jgi:hypothetical protein